MNSKAASIFFLALLAMVLGGAQALDNGSAVISLSADDPDPLAVLDSTDDRELSKAGDIPEPPEPTEPTLDLGGNRDLGKGKSLRGSAEDRQLGGCSTNGCSGFNTSPRHGCCEGYYCDFGFLVVSGTCKKSRS